MRRNFVLFVLVPLVVAGIVAYMFIDRWVESAIEFAGEQAVGARVEVDDLDLSLFPIGIGWQRMQVANPRDTWTNLFETGTVQFRMDVGQLLRAKFIIETMEVSRLIVGSRRATDGALPPEPAPEAEETESTASSTSSLTELAAPALVGSQSSVPSFDLGQIRAQLKLDSLLDASNLESVRLVDSLTREIRAAERQWDTTLAQIDAARDRMTEIERTVRSIDVNAIKTVPQAQTAFDNAKQAYEGSQQILTAVQASKRTLSASVDRLSGGFAGIDDAARRDFRTVVNLARLPDVSMSGLAQLVVGRELYSRVHEYLGYVDMVREKIPAGTGGEPAPARFRGRTIHFPTDRAYPKLWIKEIVISGGTSDTSASDHFFASGRVSDISSDQRTAGKPLVVDIEASRGPTLTTSFDATFDRLTDIPHDTYEVKATGIPLASFPLGNAGFLPARITQASASAAIAVDVPGNGLEASTRMTFAGLHITYDRDAGNQVERLTREVLSSVRSFFVDLRLWKDAGGALDVAFSTDLDDQLSSRARAVVGAEIARLTAEIRAKVDARINAKKREVMALYQQRRAEVMRRVAEAEEQVRQKVAFVEQKKKDLEDRVAAEKKRAEDELKKKAGDALKGILRKN